MRMASVKSVRVYPAAYVAKFDVAHQGVRPVSVEYTPSPVIAHRLATPDLLHALRAVKTVAV